MKTTIKNFTAILFTISLLFMASCRETAKEGSQDDTHMENTEHIDDSEHMDGSEHQDMDDDHLNEDPDHMDENDDHM